MIQARNLNWGKVVPDYANAQEIVWANNTITIQNDGFILISIGVWNNSTNIIFELLINNTQVSRLLGESPSTSSSSLRTLYGTLFFPVAAGDTISYSANITGGNVTPYYIPTR